MRKLVTKIISNRLSNICFTHNILRGLNYADLKNESIDVPIHLLNSIIENTRDNNNELWIIFQNMAKAFNSVKLVLLDKAIERIKIPEIMREFIIDLFNNRQIRVITKFGLSDSFTEEDGINQGETISPLL